MNKITLTLNDVFIIQSDVSCKAIPHKIKVLEITEKTILIQYLDSTEQKKVRLLKTVLYGAVTIDGYTTIEKLPNETTVFNFNFDKIKDLSDENDKDFSQHAIFKVFVELENDYKNIKQFTQNPFTQKFLAENSKEFEKQVNLFQTKFTKNLINLQKLIEKISGHVSTDK